MQPTLAIALQLPMPIDRIVVGKTFVKSRVVSVLSLIFPHFMQIKSDMEIILMQYVAFLMGRTTWVDYMGRRTRVLFAMGLGRFNPPICTVRPCSRTL